MAQDDLEDGVPAGAPETAYSAESELTVLRNG